MVLFNMKRKPRNLLYFSVVLSAFGLLVFMRHSSRHQMKLDVSKRSIVERPPPDEYEPAGSLNSNVNQIKPDLNPSEIAPADDPGFEPLPGRLICEPLPSVNRGPKRVVEAQIAPDILTEKDVALLPLVSGWKKPGSKVGCCPAGSRTGKIYHEGYACCDEEIYNANTSFCCVNKKRALLNTKENIEFCYPIGRPPFCRKRDLKVISPQTLACEYTKYKTPSMCEFLCPPGSLVMGNKSATCDSVGTWSNQPKCCEGCPASTVNDIWFIVDIDAAAGLPTQSDIRSFIKGLIGYMPVSQENVRVALTAFHNVPLVEGSSWTLEEYGNHDEVNAAINQIKSGGSGRNIGQALTWVASNGFTKSNGDRSKAENVVVLVTAGNSDDDIISGAEQLRAIGRFIVIAVGSGATSQTFSQIPSEPVQDNFLRVIDFVSLQNHHRFLYTMICGEGCAIREKKIVGKEKQ